MARWLLALLLVAGLGGCSSGGGGTNPNLLAPKLVLQPRPDGNVTVFVHGAFRDESYDRLALAVDNVTLANRTRAFSVEADVPALGFFLDVTAQASNAQVYQARARVDVNATAERVRVALMSDDGSWQDARAYSFPYEHVLDHPRVSP